MNTRIAVQHDLVYGWMTVEEISDGGLGQQDDARVRKALPKRAQRRSHQHTIAEPIGASDQQPLDRPGTRQLCKTRRVHSSHPSSHSISIRTAHIPIWSMPSSQRSEEHTSELHHITIS